MTPTVQLTDEQIAFYLENGYLALDAITTPEEIERMRAAYDEIFARQAGRDEGMQFDLAGTDEDDKTATLPQILDPRRYSEALRDTLYEANAHAIARQLLGGDAKMNGSHAIFKPAGYGAETPWHQDAAYWSPANDYHSLSVWMPLQEATPQNGCMEFVPGSHRREVAPHRHINNDPRIHGLEIVPDAVDLSGAASCPLPPGGATFHDSRTLHHTGPNRSDIPRRAFILIFGAPPTPRATPYDFPWQREEISSYTKKQARK